MKAKTKVILVAAVAFASGLCAALPFATRTPLPALSSEDRETLVEFYRQQAAATYWWDEYYATNDAALIFSEGERYGLAFAAFYLETYHVPPPQTTAPQVVAR